MTITYSFCHCRSQSSTEEFQCSTKRTKARCVADCQNENPQFVKKFVRRKKNSSCHIYRLSTRNTDENTKT